MKKVVSAGLIATTIQLSGCISGLENPFSAYSVIQPQPFDFITADDVPTYDLIVQLPAGESSTSIYFNGQNISHCFDFSNTPASAPLTCASEYIRQDANTLAVNPASLFGGITRSFTMDTLGPYVNIKQVCYSGGSTSEPCILRESGNVEVTVEYSDPSAIATATLNGNTAISDNGNQKTFLVGITDHYVFQTSDELGYNSTHTYSRDGLNIDELFNVRIDETMLNELRPLISDGASGVEMGTIDGSGEAILKDVKVDLGISKMGADVFYVEMGKFDMQELTIDNDSNANLHTKLVIDPTGVEGVDWIQNDGTVQNVDNVGVEVLLHINDYTDCSDAWLPNWLGGGYIGTCGILGFQQASAETCLAVGHDSTCNIGLIAIDMRMYIERMQVEGDVAGKNGGEMVANGKFSLDLIDHGTDVLKMIDVKANLSGDQSSGVSQQGLIDAIIASPAIRGMMKGIIVNVVNDNLDEIKLGANFAFDTGAEMDVNAIIQNLATDAGAGGDNIGDLRVGMSGSFITTKSDPTIKPALGSYYVNDQPALPLPADEGSNLAVSVNSNLINQALLAMYNTGATHLTLLNGVMHTGYNATDSLGKDGDFRIVLNPSSPGGFKLEGNSTDQAFIAFRGAEGILSFKENGHWQDVNKVDIDIKAGVKMDVINNFFSMTIASTPEYTINHMTDFNYNSSNLAFVIPSVVTETLLKVAIEWGIPFVADSNLIIDVAQFGISEGLFTESIDTGTGHLIFQTSVAAP